MEQPNNEETALNSPETQQRSLSPNGRGGPWFPVVMGTVGVGVVLSGIFSGSTGLYGDAGASTFSDVLGEIGREASRLIIFSVLLLLALRIQSWRLHRPLGDLTLALIRCLAVIALVEAVRVAQVQHGPMRIALIGALQYIVFTLCVMMLFASTIRETVLFTLGCTIGVVVLWLGSHLGTWIA